MQAVNALYNLYVNIRFQYYQDAERHFGIMEKMIAKGMDIKPSEKLHQQIENCVYVSSVACQYYYLACFDCRDRSKRIKIGDGK